MGRCGDRWLRLLPAAESVVVPEAEFSRGLW